MGFVDGELYWAEFVGALFQILLGELLPHTPLGDYSAPQIFQLSFGGTLWQERKWKETTAEGESMEGEELTRVVAPSTLLRKALGYGTPVRPHKVSYKVSYNVWVGSARRQCL